MLFLDCIVAVTVPFVEIQKAMDSAAKEGHLEVIAWLQAKTTAGATKSAMVRIKAP